MSRWTTDTPNGHLLLRLGWRELALRYLDSFNPQPDMAIVIANAIVDYDGPIDATVPLRHHAHDFVRSAHRLIEQRQAPVQWRSQA